MKNVKLKNTICLICHSQNTYELYPEDVDIKRVTFNYSFSPNSRRTFRVVRCKNCTHVFCSPVPKNLYRNYEDVVDKEYLRHAESRKQTAKRVINTIKKYKSSGRLLDIGCATGDFLEVAKKEGYAVEGLELSFWSSKITQKKKIPVYRKTIEAFARNFGKRYDVITMWGVIEHFEDPKKEMKYIHKLLKPGGYVVLWTGDVDGVASRVLKRRWWYWQGQHIQYFTKSSLTYLGEITGFKNIATKTYGLAVTYEQLANSLKRYNHSDKFLYFFQLIFRIKPQWYLRIPGEMFWIAQKK